MLFLRMSAATSRSGGVWSRAVLIRLCPAGVVARGRHQAMLAQTRHKLHLEKQLECFRLSAGWHQDADPTPPELLRLAVVRSFPGGPEGGNGWLGSSGVRSGAAAKTGQRRGRRRPPQWRPRFEARSLARGSRLAGTGILCISRRGLRIARVPTGVGHGGWVGHSRRFCRFESVLSCTNIS